MKNNKESICLESAVWDLHIHTCRCPKSSGDFKGLSVDKYIELLDSIFKNHKNLKMISFTDHNSISKEVYDAALSKKWDISIIIGIEADTFLDEEGKNTNDIKHVIYYFDPEKFDLTEHSRLINEKLKNGAMLLTDFLDFLVTQIKVPFLISPHFMKQEQRSIDYRWIDEIEIKKNIDKYIDQMFCFWETSSSIYIHRAQQYLKEFDREEKMSVIAFSDSCSKSKLEDYLDNPHQYFNALPTFDGIRMVGSDVRRIKFEKEYVKKEDKALFIGSVKQGDKNDIFFSNKLNAVIGGRGSGKSLLIDGIAFFLDSSKVSNNDQTKERIDYLKKLDYQVFDLNGNILGGHDFRFEYFNQGYVLNLFKNNNDDAISNIYLKDEFQALQEFDINSTRESIKQDIHFEKIQLDVTQDNLASICEKILFLDDKDLINFFKREKVTNIIDYPDLDSALTALSKQAILPSELKDNERIYLKKLELMETIYEEISNYNQSAIKKNFYSKFYNVYSNLLSGKSDAKKERRKTLKLVENRLHSKFVPIINRVLRINAFINAEKNNSDKKEGYSTGFNGSKFVFSRELKVQSLLEYLHMVFCSFFEKNKITNNYKIDRDDIQNLSYLIDIYCYSPNDYLLQSKKLDDLDNELDNLSSLKIETTNEVYYTNSNGQTIKLRNASPGTKANVLMEYIVFKKTSMPLLIDQPEDNIDNKTIYRDLTDWFNDLKSKRQVIVATHDANIVVNSDAENIIVCNQVNSNIFDYKNGALEYTGIVNDVSTILDGGRDALERRLAKYGKTN